MVSSCCAFGCTNEWTPRGNIKFHRFPIKNVERLQLWKKAIQRIDFNPTPNTVICSEHFKEEDYLESSLNKNILKRDAVPSVFKFPIIPNHMLDGSSTETKLMITKKPGATEKFLVTSEKVKRTVCDVATEASLKTRLEIKDKELKNARLKLQRKNKKLQLKKVLIQGQQKNKF